MGILPPRPFRTVLAASIAILCLVAGALAGRGSDPPRGPGAMQLVAAKKKKKLVYCVGRRTRNCIKVPAAARRPSGVDQQGQPNPRADTPDAGGVGGGGGQLGDNRDSAQDWARRQLGDAQWHWYCERFVETAFGQTSSAFPSAIAASRSMALHGGSVTNAPAGTLVYFRADPYNRQYGHVGISLGHGRMISALKTVTITNVAASPYWSRSYVGWADAPTDWPGRIPEAPSTFMDFNRSASIAITAPAPGSPVGGTIELRADARGVGGVVFDAYYATNPADPSTRGWRPLGAGQPTANGGWSLSWDTTQIPDQGSPSSSTVNIAAIALTSAGERTNVQDYRRVAIANAGSTPVTPTTTTAPTTPTTPATTTQTTPTTPTPVADGVPETTGGVAQTHSDPQSAGGASGPNIASNQTVRISCRLNGFRVQDGNTWWYRIAEAPWSNQFYVSADAFYNNGATSGSLNGTPLYDPAVPVC